MNEYPGLWRDGALLVFHRDAQFPPRCLKCNEPITRPWRKTFQWHPQWVYLLIFVHLFIYIIVAMIMRKSVRAEVGICDRHRTRRLTAILVGWGGLIGGLLLTFYAASRDWGVLVGVGALVTVGTVIYGAVAAQLVRTKKIENDYVYLAGVSPDYLAMLPGVGAPQGRGGQVAPQIVDTFD